MATDYSKVSSEALIELKTDLTHLSESLHEIYDIMNADMTQVGEYWEDPKYAEFVSGYKPQIEKCEEISKRYSEWCKKVLDPTIEKVIAIETTDVGGDGGSPTGSAGTVDSSGSTSGITDSKGNSIGSKFNLGGKKNLGSAEKNERFQKGSERVQELINKRNTPGPQGSGFSTPQNERPRLSPQQLAQLLNGKQH